MAILNHALAFADAAPEVRRAFIGGAARKQFFPVRTEFYKFTHHPLFTPGGSVTPWWSAVEPVAPGDPGLTGTLSRAQGIGVSAADFARAGSAVTRQWNRMTDVLKARLLVPVFGFVGRCASQPIDEAPDFANTVYIGGAWQVWIPGLTRGHVVAV